MPGLEVVGITPSGPFSNAGLIPIAGPSARAAESAWFRLAEDGRCFEGHFDGAPILPGVAHLALALTALERQAGRGCVLAALRDVRFRLPLHRGDEVEVVLIGGPGATSVRFEIRREGKLATSGLMMFKSDDDASGP
jgi:3-hydroxymyristoyl/3-hydroxydecanoyl-(acyl carrier protein) dehydratase